MDIIYLSYNLWSSTVQRTHHIAKGLTKYARVLYVEPPTNFLYFTNNKRNNEPPGSIRKEGDEELYILAANHTLPLKNYFYFLNQFYQNILGKEIQKRMDKLNFTNPILWCTFPLQISHLAKYNEVFSIYECMDEYSELEKTYNSLLIRNCEKKMLKSVNMAVVTSKNLEETKSKYNNNVILSPNGADVDYFKQIINNNIEKVKVFDNANPVIGYIGAIREWLDWELIKGLVELNTEWNFLFVGPVQYNIAEIKKYKNIHFTGKIDYQNLLPFLKAMDVTIVPFIINKLIDNTNPIKIYEYLAAGKPVVSTPFKEAFRFGNFIKTAKDIRGFTAMIESLLSGNDKNGINERINFASQNSWDIRVKEIINNILQHYERN